MSDWLKTTLPRNYTGDFEQEPMILWGAPMATWGKFPDHPDHPEGPTAKRMKKRKKKALNVEETVTKGIAPQEGNQEGQEMTNLEVASMGS